MTLQRIVGYTLAAVSLLTAVYNGFHFIFNPKFDIMLGLIFGGAGFVIFSATAFVEHRAGKIIQTAFIAIVAVLTIKFNDEPLLGALILFVVFSLWIVWGFYESTPWLFGPGSFAILLISFSWAYGNFQKALITTIGVSAVFLVLWAIFNHMAKNKHEELLRNYDELLKINQDLLKSKGCGDDNAGKA